MITRWMETHPSWALTLVGLFVGGVLFLGADAVGYVLGAAFAVLVLAIIVWYLLINPVIAVTEGIKRERVERQLGVKLPVIPRRPLYLVQCSNCGRTEEVFVEPAPTQCRHCS